MDWKRFSRCALQEEGATADCTQEGRKVLPVGAGVKSGLDMYQVCRGGLSLGGGEPGGTAD